MTRADLQRIADGIARQRHLLAMRDGVIGALPLTLAGSFCLLLSQLLAKPLPELADGLLNGYRMLGGIIAVYVTFAAANSLAKKYELDPVASGLLALAAFFVAAWPVSGPAPSPPAIPTVRLGAGAIFSGLLIAMLTVEITRALVRRNLTVKLPASVPEVVGRSFTALVPACVVLAMTLGLTQLAHVDVVGAVALLAGPVRHLTDNPFAAGAVALIDSSLWLIGVHASAALTGPLKPIWESMILENANAAAQGQPLPYIATQHFFIWFVWQGGSGGTLPLALMMTFAKSQQLRKVGRLGVLPSLCNINEPILFGAPVVMNPALAAPFVLAPLCCVATTYAAFSFGLVHRTYADISGLWAIPSPIGAFVSTGDWRAIVLQLFNLALAAALYWPFFRRYDRKLANQEQQAAPA